MIITSNKPCTASSVLSNFLFLFVLSFKKTYYLQKHLIAKTLYVCTYVLIYINMYVCMYVSMHVHMYKKVSYMVNFKAS